MRLSALRHPSIGGSRKSEEREETEEKERRKKERGRRKSEGRVARPGYGLFDIVEMICVANPRRPPIALDAATGRGHTGLMPAALSHCLTA
jgi:hypothetical protein